jgi:O-antigen/teichoic acid export membrane protein
MTPTPSQIEDIRKAVRKDTKWSLFMGPLRLILPAVGTLILFRVVLDTSGIEVLGLWALLSSFITYFSLVDIGFSQLLTREITTETRFSTNLAAYRDYHSAKLVYLCIFLALTPMILGLASAIPAYPYATMGVLASISLILWGTYFQLVAKLRGAILAAHQDFRYSQLVASVVPLLTSAFGIAGALLGYPIEGLGLGFFVTALALDVAIARRVRKNHAGWASISRQELWQVRPFHRSRAMVHRGLHLYTLSLGMMLRDPVFRLVIAGTLGTAALAVYAIASRASTLARDVIAGGFAVLYSSLATLFRMGDREEVVRVLKNAVVSVTALGVLSLGCFWVLVEPILVLWLNEVPDQAVQVTRILLVWNLITLFNLPFFFLLTASGNEKVVSLAAWLHAGAILLVVPAAILLPISLIELALIWAGSSVLTQMMLYTQVHVKLKLLMPVVRSRRMFAHFLLLAAFFAYCVYLGFGLLTGTTANLLLYLSAGALVYLFLAWWLNFRGGRPLLASIQVRRTPFSA